MLNYTAVVKTLTNTKASSFYLIVSENLELTRRKMHLANNNLRTKDLLRHDLGAPLSALLPPAVSHFPSSRPKPNVSRATPPLPFQSIPSSKVALGSETAGLQGVLPKLIQIFDSPLVQRTSFTALGVGLLGYFFGEYGQHHVLGNLVPKVPYLSDRFGDFGLSAMSQLLVHSASTFAISFKDKFSVLKTIAQSALFRSAPELTAIAVGAYMVLGETIAPQLMPGYMPDPLDIPAALLGCLVGYLSLGRLTSREIAARKLPN